MTLPAVAAAGDVTYNRDVHAKGLTDAEIATLAAWSDQGALEGDAKDKPAPLTFREGWNIRPDVVFQMPKPLKIPAQRTVEYTYIPTSRPTGTIRPVIDGIPDPTATVHWGDQSWQEMLTAPMAVIVDRNVDPKTVIVGGGFPGAAGAQ